MVLQYQFPHVASRNLLDLFALIERLVISLVLYHYPIEVPITQNRPKVRDVP